MESGIDRKREHELRKRMLADLTERVRTPWQQRRRRAWLRREGVASARAARTRKLTVKDHWRGERELETIPHEPARMPGRIPLYGQILAAWPDFLEPPKNMEGRSDFLERVKKGEIGSYGTKRIQRIWPDVYKGTIRWAVKRLVLRGHLVAIPGGSYFVHPSGKGARRKFSLYQLTFEGFRCAVDMRATMRGPDRVGMAAE